jgi:hypothetical protein
MITQKRQVDQSPVRGFKLPHDGPYSYNRVGMGNILHRYIHFFIVNEVRSKGREPV